MLALSVWLRGEGRGKRCMLGPGVAVRRVGGTSATAVPWAACDIALSVYSAQIGFRVCASVIAPMTFDHKNIED